MRRLARSEKHEISLAIKRIDNIRLELWLKEAKSIAKKWSEKGK